MSNRAPRRIELANAIDEYDRLIAEHNESKAETFTCYRAKLEEEGFTKAEIKLELAAAKAAIRRRQKSMKDPQSFEEKDVLTDEIFEQIKAGIVDATRMRAARGQQ